MLFEMQVINLLSKSAASTTSKMSKMQGSACLLVVHTKPLSVPSLHFAHRQAARAAKLMCFMHLEQNLVAQRASEASSLVLCCADSQIIYFHPRHSR